MNKILKHKFRTESDYIMLVTSTETHFLRTYLFRIYIFIRFKIGNQHIVFGKCMHEVKGIKNDFESEK